jgi:hypothetical protein
VLRAQPLTEIDETGRSKVPLRAYLVAPVIAAVMLAVTLLSGSRYGIGLRDPDGVIGARLLLVLGGVAIFWALDIVPRALRQARAAGTPKWATIREVARRRWPAKRLAIVLGSILAFYLIYLCYRNVKSHVPLASPGLHDTSLLELERDIFGRDPATLMHALFGTGISAHVLSVVYLLFLTFVPLSVALALVWSDDMAHCLWWLGTISFNWVLGAASYFMIPSLGPIFVEPQLFAALPETGVTALQNVLLEHRESFLVDPVGSGGLQSIAAFASLHVSIVLSGALMAHLLGAPRIMRTGLWVYFALTAVATIYFGWHYVVDDIAGVAMAFIAVFAAAPLAGWRIEWRRAAARSRQVSPEAA